MITLLAPLLLAAPPMQDAAATAAQIDAVLVKHWQKGSVQPSEPCSDATFLRRVTLDLAGRVTTLAETKAFAQETNADKRAKAIERLMASPEFALHLGRVLDDLLQDRYAGDGEFLEYLRRSVAQRRQWDQVFRDVVLGPWNDAERKGAGVFLLKRIKSLDEVTTDTSRVFFGVNVSCAQCHDHPHVQDWKQDNYYGMQSFFNRASGKGGNKNQPADVEEKMAGEVMFVTTKGERRTAKMMFLTNQILDEEAVKKASKGTINRREQLVRTALEEKTYFRRAIVNQLWSYFLGRGLVHPVDQMHSANPPAVPGLLEMLADDFADSGYDLHRLVKAIVLTRVYQLSSTPPAGGKSAKDADFARGNLRPLTPYQLASSLLIVTGDIQGPIQDRDAWARNLERTASAIAKSKLIDPRSDRYQTSTGEALYMSNHAEVQKLVEPTKTNLVGRLAALKETNEIVETAVLTVYGRAAEDEERDYLKQWVESKPDRARACRQLVWALMTSAEFRFNH